MRYRKLDEQGDMVFGAGLAAFHIDSVEAVAQAVRTRLALWKREWFLDLEEGLDWENEILGVHTEGSRDLALRAHILETQGVTEIVAYFSTLDPTTRRFTVNVTLETVYGTASLEESF